VFDFAGMVTVNYDKKIADLVNSLGVNNAGDAEESGKKRIADGLGPHDVCPKESWSSIQKSKCLV
jgi:hypothetical protein